MFLSNFKNLPLLMCLFGVITLLAQCKEPKKRSSAPRPLSQVEISDLIDMASIKFVRAGDLKSGTLSFQSKLNVVCEIEYWIRDTANNPVRKACAGSGKTFNELITSLKTSENYFFTIYFWLPGFNKSSGKHFSYDELEQLSPDRPQEPASDKKTDEIIMVRVAMPQSSVDIYRHKTGPGGVVAIKEALDLKAGCSNAVVNPVNPFNKPEAELMVSSLATAGFGAGPTATHPFHTNRLTQYFEMVDINQPWEINFKWENKDYHFSAATPPAYLGSLELLTGSESIRIKDKSLIDSLQTYKLGVSSSSLSFKWLPKNSAVNYFLLVQLKGLKSGYNISCVFKSAEEKSDVMKALVDKMPKDTYEFTAILQSTKFYTYERYDIPSTWIIHSHDWRYALLDWKSTE